MENNGDELKRKALNYIIVSLIKTTASLDDLPEENKESVLDITFNVLSAMLKPNDAVIFEDALTEHIENDNFIKIMQTLRNDFDSLGE